MTDISMRLPASREVEWGVRFAARVAEERNATRIETRDLLAGIYLSALERLGRYWDQWEHLEDFLITECDLYKPRLLYWVEMCNLLISEGLRDGLTVFGDEASKIFRRAEDVASQSGANEIRVEHFLAAVADSQSEICQRLVATGMNVDMVRRRTHREKGTA